MRLVHLYLVGYALLLLLAVIALAMGGALRQLPLIWVVLGLLVAVAFGAALLVTSRPSDTPRPPE